MPHQFEAHLGHPAVAYLVRLHADLAGRVEANKAEGAKLADERFATSPVQTTKTSVHGAINMLGVAKRLRAKILQASTSEVYGDPETHPQPEEYWCRVNPIGTRS
jgi:nucleoside-diphosphate-sugar epimerase